MTDERFFDQAGRKIIVTGHYGSGKTEFAVSLAMLLATRKSGIRNSELKTGERGNAIPVPDLKIR